MVSSCRVLDCLLSKVSYTQAQKNSFMKKTVLSLVVTLFFSSQLSAQSAPGGVSLDLNYWLKADVGVEVISGRVSQWDNQTSAGGSINQTAVARQPGLKENALNFNPAISFNTADNDFDFLSTDDLVWDSDTVILVFNPTQESASNGPLQAVLVYNIPNNQFGDAGIGIGSISGFRNDNFFNSTDISPIEPGEYIATSRVSDASTGDAILAVVRQDQSINPTRSQHRFWGNDTTINITNLDQYAPHQNTEFTIGQRDGGGLPFDGDVLEAISYSSRLDDASLRRIESYLSIKYGLTLNQSTRQDYLDSSANSIYDADGDLSAFVSNIAGIGRDDGSGLNQKQSVSSTTNSVQTNVDGLVTIGLGTIATSNRLNPNTFTADQAFMLWGNNAASLDFDIALTISTMPYTRMQRIWAIQETGSVGSVTLKIAKSVFSRRGIPSLIVSSDPTLEQENVAINLMDDGNNNYQASVDFNDGDYFTFAQSDDDFSDEVEFFITPLPNGNTVIFGL